GHPILYVEAIPTSIPLFKRKIKFKAESLDEVISISIQGITSSSKLISGFLSTLQKFINAQYLERLFGTVNHIIAQKPLPLILSK
ncbi:hypothetical protein P154DRAFT_425428, partial [Amniculicola lignicola CBS 123094]